VELLCRLLIPLCEAFEKWLSGSFDWQIVMDGDPDLLRFDAASLRKWFAALGREAAPSSSRIEDAGDTSSHAEILNPQLHRY
jgi:hypothetical protein